MVNKPKIAMFSPIHPVKSGISGYTEKLIRFLHSIMDIDLFIDGYDPDKRAIPDNISVYHYREFEWLNRLRSYDLVVYHIGNSKHHQYMYPVLFRYPGVVILHDVNLHRARAYKHLNSNKLGDYLDEMRYCHGSTGEDVGWLVARGFDGELLYDRFDMLDLICRSGSGFIVHNEYAVKQIQKTGCESRIVRVPFPCVEEELPDPSKARRFLNISSNEYVIASFGFIAPGKGLESALAAFQRLEKKQSECRFLLVGECLDMVYLNETLDNLTDRTRRKISIPGYVSSDEYKQYLAASDVCINLRYPSQGESSSALLGMMSAAKPVLISNYRQYREFPRDTCVHIDLSPDETEAVYQALSGLTDPQIRIKIGQQAKKYVFKHHKTTQWTTQINDFLNEMIEHPGYIAPLSSHCDLPFVNVMSIQMHVALTLYSWVDTNKDDIVFTAVGSVLSELGINA